MGGMLSGMATCSPIVPKCGNKTIYSFEKECVPRTSMLPW